MVLMVNISTSATQTLIAAPDRGPKINAAIVMTTFFTSKSRNGRKAGIRKKATHRKESAVKSPSIASFLSRYDCSPAFLMVCA